MRLIASCCVLLLLQPAAIPAQAVSRGSWDAVTQLNPEQKVEVYPARGKRLRAQFRSATPDSVTLSTKSGDITLSRADVRDFKVRKTSGRFRNAGIGAAIGGGIMGALIAIAIRGDFDDSLAVAIFAVFTSAAAFTGFLIGVAFPGYNTIYRVG